MNDHNLSPFAVETVEEVVTQQTPFVSLREANAMLRKGGMISIIQLRLQNDFFQLYYAAFGCVHLSVPDVIAFRPA